MFVRLCPGDEARVEAFLRRHAASSLFLRSNLRAAGLVDRGQHYEGTWVAALERDGIRGVVSHAWNGTLLLQAPADAAALARFAAVSSGRPSHGLIGPCDQVAATREALGLSTAATRLDSREDLFSLELSALAVPLILRDGRVTCRRSAARDLTTLVAWRKDYENSIFTGPNPGGSNATMVHRLHDDGWLFVLTADDGNLVSMCAYNAVVPDCVQIGGVWTPPDLRRRGYGRAVVAGALLQARSAGARTSVLFTDVLNEPAARAYRSLGYARVGCYSLLLFRDGHPVDGA